MRADGVQLQGMAPVGHRSPTVTAVSLPESLSGPNVVRAMKERGGVIGGGYGKLKESGIRITRRGS